MSTLVPSPGGSTVAASSSSGATVKSLDTNTAHAAAAVAAQPNNQIETPPIKPVATEARKTTFYDHANILSQWTFWWLNGLLQLGHTRPLQDEDIPPLPQQEKAHEIDERMMAILDDIYKMHQPGSKIVQQDGEDTTAGAPSADTNTQTNTIDANNVNSESPPLSAPPSFVRVMWRLIGWKYCSALGYAFVSETFAFAGPILVDLITGFLDDEDAPEWNGWLYVALLFVLPTIASICRYAYFLNSWRVAVRLRSGILTAVFRKSLKLSPAARRLVTDGEILTLISADAQKLQDIFPVLYVLLTAPLSILACFVLIWLQVGASTLAGAGVIAILMPINIWLGKKSGGYRREEAAQTDLRMRYVKEAMTNMKVIKQYGWASSFEKRITDVRTKEIAIRQKAAYLEAFSNSILILTPVLISLVTFLTFAGSGHQLTATNVFTSMALFNVMRFQLSQFPLVLTAIFEARVSLQRILRLLLREELSPTSRDYSTELPPLGQPIAEIRNATFSWDMPEDMAHTSAKDVLATKSKGGGEAAVGTDSNFRLTDIRLSITRGKFVGVVGQVGSGKSSILQALLGEVKRTSGPKVFLRGRVALIPQTAWILNMSLRENILFGLPFDESIYKRTIDVCCLTSDLSQLPGGDATQIGDRGVNLSGGQKQRCAIGRCVYSVLMGQSDLVLVDDPLSAVDAHVSKALFENVFARTGILGRMGITVILALNQLHYLPMTDHVVVMKGGRIAQQGQYSALMQQQDGELASLMSNYGFNHDNEEEEEETVHQDDIDAIVPPSHPASQSSSPNEAVAADPTVADAPVNTEVDPQKPSVASASASPNMVSVAAPAAAAPDIQPLTPAAPPAVDAKTIADTAPAAAPAGGTITKAETRVEGSVGLKVYKAYIDACGGWIVFISLNVLFCIHQTGRVYADFWLADWAEQDWDNPSRTLAFWMGIFALFGGVVTIASLIRSSIFARQGLVGSYNLHQQMLSSIFRSPASFFDTTPIGRIVNRFSGDIDKLDHLIVRTLEGWGGCVYFVAGTLVAIVVVFPWFALVLVGVLFIYYKVQQYYVASSRELQRLDSISKSPIISTLGESLAGASSIRAYQVDQRFYQRNERNIDANHRNVLGYNACLCWLGIRIELISTLLMTVSAIFAVTARRSIEPSLVGLTIVYSITITSFLNFGVRLGSVVEGLMSSVERIDEYSVLPSEAPDFLPDVDPPSSWPERGEITFEKCVLKYRPELEDVLKGISATIRGGEKIGIIGRTGSGKSSMMVALFRLVELTSGRILLDGVDIRTIGLETLRSRVTLIPQEPVIFNGTVRYNLDPFAQSSEADMWRVLRMVNLETKIRSMDGQLEFQLSEGESLSVGERQLLCVARSERTVSAQDSSESLLTHCHDNRLSVSMSHCSSFYISLLSRALLRRTSILILDEATASVDIESDVLIQQVIAEHFQQATVLAIAHRLSTIIDFDRILVMDAGRVVEFGVPHLLLQDPNSALLSLVDATGSASANHLKALAKLSHENVLAGRPAHVQANRDANETTSEYNGPPLDPNQESSCVRFHAE